MASPVVITVSRVEQPAPGKKQGAVFDTTDKRWGVWPDHLDDFEPGMTYRLTEVKTNNFNNKTYFTIVKAEPMPDAPMAAPAPRPATQAAGELTKQTELIFGQNQTAGWIAAQAEYPSEEKLIEIHRRVRNVLRAVYFNKQQRDDMNDEIPY